MICVSILSPEFVKQRADGGLLLRDVLTNLSGGCDDVRAVVHCPRERGRALSSPERNWLYRDEDLIIGEVAKKGRRTSSLRNAAMSWLIKSDLPDETTCVIKDEDVAILSITDPGPDEVLWARYQYRDARPHISLSRWPETWSAAICFKLALLRRFGDAIYFREDIEHVWGFEDRELGGRINHLMLSGSPIRNSLSSDFLIEGSPSMRDITPEDFVEVQNILYRYNIYM